MWYVHIMSKSERQKKHRTFCMLLSSITCLFPINYIDSKQKTRIQVCTPTPYIYRSLLARLYLSIHPSISLLFVVVGIRINWRAVETWEDDMCCLVATIVQVGCTCSPFIALTLCERLMRSNKRKAII